MIERSRIDKKYRTEQNFKFSGNAVSARDFVQNGPLLSKTNAINPTIPNYKPRILLPRSTAPLKQRVTPSDQPPSAKKQRNTIN